MGTPTGAPDWSGTATLSRAVVAIQTSNKTIASQGVFSWNGQITRQGYEIWIQLGNTTHTSTLTPALIEMVWQEQQTSQVTGYQRHWVMSGDSTGAHQIVGSGPSNGNYLTVTVTNWNASTPSFNVSMVVQDVARNYQYHDWMTRDTLSPSFPDQGLANSDAAAGLICAIQSQNVPAGGGTGLLLPYRPGNYQLSMVNDGSVQLFPFIAAFADYGVVASPIVWHESLPATSIFLFAEVSLPNAQCTMSVTNGSSTKAGSFDATLTRLPY